MMRIVNHDASSEYFSVTAENPTLLNRMNFLPNSYFFAVYLKEYGLFTTHHLANKGNK